jgi:hypothetical protein
MLTGQGILEYVSRNFSIHRYDKKLQMENGTMIPSLDESFMVFMSEIEI